VNPVCEFSYSIEACHRARFRSPGSAGGRRVASSPALPDVPAFEPAGIKGLVSDQWLGVLVPQGTPAAIVVRLNQEIGWLASRSLLSWAARISVRHEN
jgi:tripartite-type tricarboxylate transporter receptor subunit TctC